MTVTCTATQMADGYWRSTMRQGTRSCSTTKTTCGRPIGTYQDYGWMCCGVEIGVPCPNSKGVLFDPTVHHYLSSNSVMPVGMRLNDLWFTIRTKKTWQIEYNILVWTKILIFSFFVSCLNRIGPALTITFISMTSFSNFLKAGILVVFFFLF